MVNCLEVCVHVCHTCAACGVLKRALDPLELQVTVSYHVGAGIEPRPSSALNH